MIHTSIFTVRTDCWCVGYQFADPTMSQLSHLVWSHYPWRKEIKDYFCGFTPPILLCLIFWSELYTVLSLSAKCKHRGWKSSQTRKNLNVSVYLINHKNKFNSNYINLTNKKQGSLRKYELYDSWKLKFLLFCSQMETKYYWSTVSYEYSKVHWLSF